MVEHNALLTDGLSATFKPCDMVIVFILNQEVQRVNSYLYCEGQTMF